MSLVEQALKKMQSAKAAAAVPARPAPEPTAADTTTQRAPAAVSVSLPPPPARTLTLNYAGLRSQGLYPPEHELRQIAQQYRQIKRPIIGSALGHNAPKLPSGHIIMVASAMPGEGKTFTSINLALSMAREKDVRVLLVDADVPKPHISRIFGVEDEPGLLDALRDSTMDVESLILPTDVPSLSIMPAGRRSENATELLASARMGEVVRSLAIRDAYRMVLFDSPPLMLTTESHALAQEMGQVVLVVRAGVTPQQVLLDAVRILGDRPVSFILNQSVSESTAEYYYYGYGDNREGTS